MGKRTAKEDLFGGFYYAALAALEALEFQYDVEGVVEQVFGPDPQDNEEEAKRRLRESRPWRTLSDLYDYAVDGVDHGNEPPSIVIDGSDVLKLATSENHRPADEWDEIVSMADGRFALDDGMSIELYKVALLAGVDVRTVRNAISAGELTASKHGDMVFVENSSARRWLHGRKGFKPTVHRDAGDLGELASVKTPAAFGAFLAARRQRLGLGSSVVPLVPGVPAEELAKLEAGMFPVPLDAAFPMADFYQVSRKEFLEAVMRIFFPEELAALRDARDSEAQS